MGAGPCFGTVTVVTPKADRHEAYNARHPPEISISDAGTESPKYGKKASTACTSVSLATRELSVGEHDASLASRRTSEALTVLPYDADCELIEEPPLAPAVHTASAGTLPQRQGGSSSPRQCFSPRKPVSPAPGLVKHTKRLITGADSEGNKTINQYVVVATIGRGAYGKVKLVADVNTNSCFAIKILKKNTLTDKCRHGSGLTSIQREIGVMKSLRHDCIVRLFEVIDDDCKQKIYLVMEHLENGPIAEVMSDGTVRCPRPYPTERLQKHLRQVSTGLGYLHHLEIIHGDVKPSNVLIDSRDNVKLTDFGQSRPLTGSAKALGEGTLAFLSPEEVQGTAQGSFTADVWALGVTLYCVVFSRLPFYGGTYAEVMDAITQKSPPLEPPQDPELMDLLYKVLEKDCNQRISLQGVLHHPFLFSLDALPSEALNISLRDFDGWNNAIPRRISSGY